MKKGKTQEPGLAYMKELGLKPEMTRAKCMKAVARATDEPTAFAINEGISMRGDAHGASGDFENKRFYDIKNKSLEASMTLSGAFDGDFYRKACNWLAEHKDCLRGRVLDIGCDCGLMSCFIARLVPDCQVFAIDQSTNAVDNGRALAERLKLRNIVFVPADLASFADVCEAKGWCFDTVVSSRVSQENMRPEEVDCRGKGFCEEADEYAAALGEYDALLDRVLAKDGGILVCIERTGLYPYMLGMLNDLQSRGLVLCQQHGADLFRCTEIGHPVDYSAFVFGRFPEGKAYPAGVLPFIATVATHLDVTGANYELYEAKLVEDIRRGPLIDGFTVSASDGSQRWRCSYWKHDSDPTNTLFYKDINGYTELYFLDVDRKDMVEKMLADFRSQAAGLGLLAKPMDPEIASRPSELGEAWRTVREFQLETMKNTGGAVDGTEDVMFPVIVSSVGDDAIDGTKDNGSDAAGEASQEASVLVEGRSDGGAAATVDDRTSTGDDADAVEGPSGPEPNGGRDGSVPDFFMPMFVSH